MNKNYKPKPCRNVGLFIFNNMPCYQEPMYYGPSREDTLRTKNTKLQNKLNDVTTERNVANQNVKHREAMVCAILSEISKEKYALNVSEIIEQAEECGKIEIKAFWLEHQKEGLLRLNEKLNKMFSSHELELIQVMFKDGLV